jgi:8-amino-7-oxononanoate synthase
LFLFGLTPFLFRHDFGSYCRKTENNIEVLRENIIYFNQEKNLLGSNQLFVRSCSPAQSAIIQAKSKAIATIAGKWLKSHSFRQPCQRSGGT